MYYQRGTLDLSKKKKKKGGTLENLVEKPLLGLKTQKPSKPKLSNVLEPSKF